MDLEDWLRSALPTPACSGDGAGAVRSLPAQLDRFYNVYLPSRVNPGQVPQNACSWPDLPRALEQIERWLEAAGFKNIEISVVAQEEQPPNFQTILAAGEK